MNPSDYGVDFPSSRPDGIGLAARLDIAFPEQALMSRYTVALHGIHVPYRALGRTGVKRINIGPRGDGDRLPRLGADLEIVSKSLRCGRFVNYLLSNFTEGDKAVEVGRPISAGKNGSQFGAAALDYEAFRAFRMQANASTGECVLEGMIVDEDGFDYIELARSGVEYPNGTVRDAYRFGNSCMIALGNTAVKPVLWVPES